MNTQITSKNSTLQFTVSKKQVHKNKTLKTGVLYQKIETSVTSSLVFHKNFPNLSFKSIDFDIIKNAYLNDNLIIKNNIKKLSDTEIILQITVSKEEKKQEIICKALFGYHLQKAS
ncbi:hypothetical protein [Tenacibaculum finnmarkense]|uniref:hypothetical protein n=1 Tax=Tenacibaculum finnmarkense TaxID=2781243 RepID=UPI000C57F209|nr:hypothetical protein [Tenacibaculum finnmarkense]MCD8440426.1 hypothetical protein [Tenacibaculum finnmarkense genomovar ulcerans]MCG8721321.1 hypothetical protein [Tenacibaculum finnmarkense]SOS55158.1 conserved hypothetical protein [Tenacibaculum finnmarkense]